MVGLGGNGNFGLDCFGSLGYFVVVVVDVMWLMMMGEMSRGVERVLILM